MASVSFTCPNCAKVLRTSKRPADGKKIKCPGCAEIFVPELDAEEDAEDHAEPERPRVVAKAPAKKKAEADEELDEEKPRRKKARARDEDDEIEEDDDEIDERRGKKKKGKKKKAGGLMLTLVIVFGATFAIAGCAACGVGAWVWPGFLIPTTNNNDINAYIPVASTSLLGLDAVALGQKNELEPALAFIDGWRAKPNTQLPAEVRELIRNSEKVLVCTQALGLGNVDLIAILAKDAAAVNKFKSSPELGAQERLEKRHIVYKSKGRNGWPVHVAIPGDRLVLLGDFGQQFMLEVLKRGDQPDGEVSAPARFRKAVDQNALWCSFAYNERMRMQMSLQFAGLALAPGMKAPVEGFLRSSGGSWSAESAGPEKWRVRLNLECASPADAVSMKTGGPRFQKLTLEDATVPPPVATDIMTMTFANQGPTLNVTMEVTQNSLTAFNDLQKKKLPF